MEIAFSPKLDGIVTSSMASAGFGNDDILFPQSKQTRCTHCRVYMLDRLKWMIGKE